VHARLEVPYAIQGITEPLNPACIPRASFTIYLLDRLLSWHEESKRIEIGFWLHPQWCRMRAPTAFDPRQRMTRRAGQKGMGKPRTTGFVRISLSTVHGVNGGPLRFACPLRHVEGRSPSVGCRFCRAELFIEGAASPAHASFRPHSLFRGARSISAGLSVVTLSRSLGRLPSTVLYVSIPVSYLPVHRPPVSLEVA
jgi:hypothetical protein